MFNRHKFMAGPSLKITELGEVKFHVTHFPVKVVVKGKHAYMAELDSGIQVFDVSNPQVPTKVGQLRWQDVRQETYGIETAGDYAYIPTWRLSEGFTECWAGVQIVDISNPVAPVLAGSYEFPGGYSTAVLAGQYVYLAEHDGELRIIDISNPRSPRCERVGKISGVPYRIVTDGKRLYALSDGLRVLDIGDPAVPIEIGWYETGSRMNVKAGSRVRHGSYNLAVSGGVAFLADGQNGLRIIDVSNPATACEIGSCATPHAAMDVAISGHFAFVACQAEDGPSHWKSRGSLRVMDIRNAAAPVETGYFDTVGSARSIAVVGNCAYVAGFTHFSIYDCSAALRNAK